MNNFLRDESAAGLVEYALIMGIVSITVIIAMVFMRGQLDNLFHSIGNAIGPSGASGACQAAQQQGQCP
ncbi:MAG: Flp family type IVb pilin [Chloroflexota bacterium]|nr:Flp family type IVb pilin [Chloroflexota bacterium]